MYKKYQKEYCALYRIDPLIIRYSSISHIVFLILKNLLSDIEVATSAFFFFFFLVFIVCLFHFLLLTSV